MRLGENMTPSQFRLRICSPCQKALNRAYRAQPEAKERRKLYEQSPEYREKRLAYMRRWRAQHPLTLEEKEKYRLLQRIRRQRLDEKEKIRQYNRRPEVRARMRISNRSPEHQEQKRLYQKSQKAKESRKRYLQRLEVKEHMQAVAKAYGERPDVKQKRSEYAKLYSQRPEVKEKRRLYQQRPEVKQRLHEKWLALSPEEKAKKLAPWTKYFKEHNRAPYVPIIDCFEKDWPKTFDELLYASGAGKIYLRLILQQYVQIGLVKDLGYNSFCLNKKSPLRMAADGYFKEATREKHAHAGSENGGE